MSADDIVDILHRLADRFYGMPDVSSDIIDAADEIERLRAELDRVSGGRWTAAELDAAKWRARELTLRMAEWSEPRPVGEA